MGNSPTPPIAINPLTASFALKVKTCYHLRDISFREGTLAVYGKGIELLESPNDTTHEFTDVDGSLEPWEETTLNTAIADGDIQAYQAGIVLNDLVRRGVLPAGSYFIRVSW